MTIFAASFVVVFGWILVIGSLLGIVVVGALSIWDARERRRLNKMRAESDRKRDDYFVLSDKLNAPDPRTWRPRRARFLPR